MEKSDSTKCFLPKRNRQDTGLCIKTTGDRPQATSQMLDVLAEIIAHDLLKSLNNNGEEENR